MKKAGTYHAIPLQNYSLPSNKDYINNKKMMSRSGKVSVRVTPHQELVLSELSAALGTNYSMLIRTIIGSWLTENEEYLYRLIDRKKLEADPDYKVPEDNNNIFE